MKKILLGILLFLPFLVWSGAVVYKVVIYNIDCGGHLKRAADSNTIDIAKKELKTALDYLEKRGMTSGYTSVLYRTPDEDVGFWYQNLHASYLELDAVVPEASQLERSNVLMKLRETLLDPTQSGVQVTEPAGISVFPNNTAWFIFGLLTSILASIGGVIAAFGISEY